MSRLIDADELLEKIDAERKYLIERGQTGAEHILAHNFRDLVLNAPTVEPKTGRWFGAKYDAGLGLFLCDNCGRFSFVEYDFCPNCGADMRGE